MVVMVVVEKATEMEVGVMEKTMGVGVMAEVAMAVTKYNSVVGQNL
jgi:hypothetical protein